MLSSAETLSTNPQEKQENKQEQIINIPRHPSPPIVKNIQMKSRLIKVQQMQLRVKPPIFTGEYQHKSMPLRKKELPKDSVNHLNKSKPSHFIFPSYLHMTETSSPHLLAHSIILSDKNLNDSVEQRVPNLHQELQAAYPKCSKKQTLGHPNHFFFDLFHLSIGLSDPEYVYLVSNFISYRNKEITKTRCHINSQNILTQNRNSHFLVPRILTSLSYNQKDELDESLNKKNTKISNHYDKNNSNSALIRISNFLARQVTEFTDRREPLPYIEELPKYIATPIPDIPHTTKSYVKMPSPHQQTAFGAFLFNSEYVSVSSGAEGENTGNYADDDFIEEYRKNLDNYFCMSANIPFIQTVGSTLMRAYSLLICDPRPSFNLFPGYLVYSITLIYEKAARRILNLMTKNYNAVLPEIAQTILNAIDKTNEVTPQWDYYLMTRNVIFASKHILKYSHEGRNTALKIMNELTRSKTFTLTLGKEELDVITFLRAFLEEALPTSSFKSFFKLFNSINDIELLITRPFAAALLMVPVFTKLFRELEIEYENRMNDDLFLHGKDRFLLKVSEKLSGPKKTVYDSFIIRSDVPLSMRMFLEYAIVMKTAKKDILPQKLTFTNLPGFKLISELETFSSIISSFLISMDFKALKNLYKAHIAHKNLNYELEAAKILQGRDIIGIIKINNTTDIVKKESDNIKTEIPSEKTEIQYCFRKIIPKTLPHLSTSFMFAFGPSGNYNESMLNEGIQNRSNDNTSLSLSDGDMTADSNDEEPPSVD